MKPLTKRQLRALSARALRARRRALLNQLLAACAESIRRSNARLGIRA